jgi:hypothetical protein
MRFALALLPEGELNLFVGRVGLSAGADGIVEPQDWALLVAAIPEPGTLSGLLIATFFASRRDFRCKWRGAAV